MSHVITAIVSFIIGGLAGVFIGGMIVGDIFYEEKIKERENNLLKRGN